MMPLYEAKMMHHYDTRWATYEPDGSTRLMTPDEKARRVPPQPLYWVHEDDVATTLGEVPPQRYFLGFRDITNATNIRTMIAAKFGFTAVANNLPLILTSRSADEDSYLQSALSSFAHDFIARQKIGGTHANFFIVKQLPVPGPSAQVPGLTFDRQQISWVATRVDRLNGWIQDDTTRRQLRAELDAYHFHLYGLNRTDASYILDSFSGVRDADVAATGAFTSKDLVLAAYDSMAAARTEQSVYKTPWEDS